MVIAVREHRLGFAVAILMVLRAGAAFADVTASPNSVTCPAAPLNMSSSGVNVTFNKSGGSSNIDVTVGSCSGGGGTFYLDGTALSGSAVTIQPSTVSITFTPEDPQAIACVNPGRY